MLLRFSGVLYPSSVQVARGLPLDETRAVQQLRVGVVVRGRVVAESTRGYLVRLDRVVHLAADRAVLCNLPHNEAAFRAVLPFSSLSQGFVTANDTLLAAVREVDPDGERVLLSLDRDAMSRPQTPVRLGVYDQDDNGRSTRGSDATHPYVAELALRAVCHTSEASAWLEQRWEISQASSLIKAWHRVEHARDKCHAMMREQQDLALAASKVAQGVQHQKAGRKAEALACYERALLVCPHSADAFVARGALRTTENKCVVSSHVCITTQKCPTEDGVVRGMCLANLWQMRVCLWCMTPTDVIALRSRITFRFDMAVEDLVKARRLDPEHRQWLLLLAFAKLYKLRQNYLCVPTLPFTYSRTDRRIPNAPLALSCSQCSCIPRDDTSAARSATRCKSSVRNHAIIPCLDHGLCLPEFVRLWFVQQMGTRIEG